MSKISLIVLLCLHVTVAFCQEVLTRQPLSVKVLEHTRSYSMLAHTHLNSYEVKVARIDSTWSINLGSSNGGVKCVEFNAAENRIAFGCYNGTLEMWDLANGTLLWSVVAHQGQINDIKFSDDNDFLITCGVDGKIKLHWVENGGFIKAYACRSAVNAVEFHPLKKNTFVTGDHEGNITWWKINAKKPLRTLKAHDSYLFDLEFTQTGTRLLSSSHDQTIKTWDFALGVLLNTSTGHTRAVYSISISPDGKTFASGGFDKKIGIWNLQTGRNIKFLSGHADYVNVVHFTPEGQLLSGSRDGTLRIWDNTK